MTVARSLERIFNFSPGPAVLPLPVLEEVQQHLLALPGAGASILEISHRGKLFEGILEDAKERLRRLLGIPSGYHVLFLQGGASLQFSMVPLNFLGPQGAAYVEAGSWSRKAMAEARKVGPVHVAWSGKEGDYDRMPEAHELDLPARAHYLHITSNETIQGIEIPSDYQVDLPVVCDASSDILSRPLDVSRYALIYAGAQKNMGPAGATLVILSEEFLSRQNPGPHHSMLDYRLLADNNSLYNTPCVFAIYIIGLVARWLEEEVGGLAAMHSRNKEKAALLYQAIDASGGFYRGHAQPQSRSLMNVTFRTPSEELDRTFVAEAQEQGLAGLKGHRQVGGLRASIYNAFPLAGVQALVEFMADFARRYG
ncbi:MAG TPA: 3-phosphoserine/phosphohydroxythreonine transaminase [Candidatus Nitrosotenuis sp.]|jgi:phosphoserine aminotransferase|nr:3-phosphoserine/phosphohydroxythreonine transaminase [Candidatus Nitrosotenuis sp.]